MEFPLPQGDITFDVIHNDGWIRACTTEGFATIYVDSIGDVGVMIRAINRAFATGATKGAMFTGGIVNERTAKKHLAKVSRKTAWLGGKFTRLADGEDGPMFRVDWDELPSITE